MRLNEIDPLQDRRWIELTGRCPESSVFHTPQWLEVLRRTYGYQSVVFTDAQPGEPLGNGLLFCRVKSWMTGRRLVSLPFSDHCEPLVQSSSALSALLALLEARLGSEGRYIEMRPLKAGFNVEGFSPQSEFFWHSIDLRPSLDAIFSRFHKSHAQRAIHKAQRSGLTLVAGRAMSFLTGFYALHVMTRHRHETPVQPFSWFRNLADCFGDRLTIYMARYREQPVAAIMTLTHGSKLVFKYGCSNRDFNRYGGTPHLFWRAIQDAKEQGLQEFDLGRSDIDNEGLIAFKDHLGASRTTLNYYRYPGRGRSASRQRWISTVAAAVYSVFPDGVRDKLSGRFYKHFA